MSSTLRKKVQNNIKFSFNVETSTAAFLVIIDVPNYIRTLKIYCRHDDCYNVFNCILWNLAFVEGKYRYEATAESIKNITYTPGL